VVLRMRGVGQNFSKCPCDFPVGVVGFGGTILVLKFNTFCVNNVTSFLWPCKFVDLMLNSSVDFRVRDRDGERYFGG
jgi:hypothetical protein